jgi:hypothetical protein
MPFRLKDSSKYRWLTDIDVVPLAPAVSIGAATYILCCPLCGCCHELIGQTFTSIGQQIVTKPRCLLREFASMGRATAWKLTYEAWTAQHPDAVQTDEIRCIYLGGIQEIVTVAAAMKALKVYAQTEQELQAAA